MLLQLLAYWRDRTKDGLDRLFATYAGDDDWDLAIGPVFIKVAERIRAQARRQDERPIRRSCESGKPTRGPGPLVWSVIAPNFDFRSR